AEPWPAGERVRRAGVSSFGISGTNAHVIVEESPLSIPAESPVVEAASEGVLAWAVSAKTRDGVRDQAVRLRDWLVDHPEAGAADVAYSLLRHRSQLEWRAAVVGRELADLNAGLARLAESVGDTDGVVSGRAVARQVAFVFPGQGSQWGEMGAELLAGGGVFAESIAECDAALAPFVDWSLTAVLRGDPEAPSLERVDVVQPLLFAVMVSLARLWRSSGVEPAVVIGHSQGEIAAAVVAGGLSLSDGARVVALRSRAVAEELAGSGGMASVGSDVDAVRQRLLGFGDRLSVAAVNGPGQVVVSGEASAVDEFLAGCADDGVWAKRIPVDYASHSTAVESIRDRVLAELAPVRPHTDSVPFFSTVVGDYVDTGRLDAGYWYRGLREQVRFAESIEALIGAGVNAFIEVSPHPVLTMGVESTAEALSVADRVVVLGTLRRGHGGPEQVAVELARAYCAGVAVAKTALAPTAARVTLPTYAFQHQRYWLQPSAEIATGSFGHPLLTNAVQLAGKDEWLFTGRVSVRTHPWLADHAVFGSALLPGTGFLELALTAGVRLGAEFVEELLLEEPLPLADDAAVDIQFGVEPADEAGRRRFVIHSRVVADGDSEAGEWVSHASGVLAPAAATVPAWIESERHGSVSEEWPPAGADPVPTDGLYDHLAELGFGYGPAFQGVGSVWRDGDDLLAEVSLPADVGDQALSFGIHPALLDAAFHAAIDGLALDMPSGRLPLPFSFTGARLYRAGVPAIRVRLVRLDAGRVHVVALDHVGAPVLSLESLTTRPVDAKVLIRGFGRRASLSDIEWVSAPPRHTGVVGSMVVLDAGHVAGADVRADLAELLDSEVMPEVVVWSPGGDGSSGGDDGDVAVRTRAWVHSALKLLQTWQAQERSSGSRLVVLTRGAMGAPGELSDPAGAAVWGLVRSAQSEYPGRFVLVDVGVDEDVTVDVIAAVVSSEEPQLAVRGGRLRVPRLRRQKLGPALAARSPLGTGAVLITGGSTGLGAVVARHVVDTYSVQRLVLVSRRGERGEGVAELVSDLTAAGAQVRVVACDVSDRAAVAALLAGLPKEFAPSAVIHSAGVLDDGTIETLTGEQVDRVLAPKVDAAWHLHELTKDRDLSAFVLFSSAAGVVGLPGQGNYAAANAFLDALAWRRRAAGLPAVSIAWGAWNQGLGMTSGLDGAAMARLGRMGVRPLETADGLALFDHAIGAAAPAVIGTEFDTEVLSVQARAGSLPRILHSIVAVPVRRAADTSGTLGRRLGAARAAERAAIVLDVVREQIAGVLGHISSDVIDPTAPFTELGFDSLAGLEFRNRLAKAIGVQLPSTLVFDHPTAAAVAAFIHSRIGETDADAGRAVARPARRIRTDEPIAIVGMSCRFPGGVESPGQLWDLVASGSD
ncbi:type I polyketide synthase, partial [Nocardia sp. NPDC023852]|uniref:type I polyketide synthase n=1 Tax=Nocardia sp. NPDC023852 TaxID=3154697 RepID=UPI0033E92499